MVPASILSFTLTTSTVPEYAPAIKGTTAKAIKMDAVNESTNKKYLFLIIFNLSPLSSTALLLLLIVTYWNMKSILLDISCLWQLK